jgi:hypothetical protein
MGEDVVGVLGVPGGSGGTDGVQTVTTSSRVGSLSSIASCIIVERRPELGASGEIFQSGCKQR